MAELLLDIIKDTALDCIVLLPFLFVAYLLMEILEHKAGEKARAAVERAGRFGPLIGGILGVIPQCGFCAVGSSLYAGRVITLGTLFSIYLATSDEMLPLMIAGAAPAYLIGRILLLKVLIGMAAGFIIDLLVQNRRTLKGMHIHEMCEAEGCGCSEENVFSSAFVHTFKVFLFIVIITFALNLLLGIVGEDVLADVFGSRDILATLLATVVGLIPNCAASVVITQSYLKGVLSFGAMMAGLLSSTGLGVLILFRSNRRLKENVLILAALVGISFGSGMFLEIIF